MAQKAHLLPKASKREGSKKVNPKGIAQKDARNAESKHQQEADS